MTSNNHGGRRAGSGRKREEATKTIRVPVALLEKIKKMISEHKELMKNGGK